MSCRLLSPDLGFGLLPERFQLLNAAALKIALQGGLHSGEAIEKAVVGAGQPLLGIEATPARHIHEGEQQIAQFLLGMALIAAGMAEKREEKRRLMDAASAAGSVFYFDYDSSSLGDDVRAAIDAHVALMMADSGNVRLEGHTDERGTREYNLALGERRANAVRDYMVASGVPAYRIETISYGEENPVAYGSGESSWKKNRRVEIK